MTKSAKSGLLIAIVNALVLSIIVCCVAFDMCSSNLHDTMAICFLLSLAYGMGNVASITFLYPFLTRLHKRKRLIR